MKLSYNRLWKLFVDRKISKSDLRKAVKISPNTMTKLRKDESVNMDILKRNCLVLEVDLGDIAQFVAEENSNGLLDGRSDN